MWNQFFIKDAHLVTSSVRDDHLGRRGQLPVVQLLDHPFSNVDGGVLVGKWHTSQDKGLAAPVIGNEV